MDGRLPWALASKLALLDSSFFLFESQAAGIFSLLSLGFSRYILRICFRSHRSQTVYGFIWQLSGLKAGLVSCMMELGRRIFAGIFLVIFLLIGFTRGEDALKQKGIKDPRAHPNLSPFEQWRSAYDCLQNTSSTCPDKFQLTPKGWVNVTNNDTSTYCDYCKDHTLDLLKCLEDVMRGRSYVFESGEQVGDISCTISQGCSMGRFNGTALRCSNARTLQGSKTVTSISVLAAWLFITYITM